MRDSVLRIYSRSGFFVGEIRHYLAQVEYAYNSLYTLEVFVGAVERSAQNWLVPYGFGAFWGFLSFRKGVPAFSSPGLRHPKLLLPYSLPGTASYSRR
jgi:hypothetical protein